MQAQPTTTDYRQQTETAIAARIAATTYDAENAYPSGPELVRLVWDQTGGRVKPSERTARRAITIARISYSGRAYISGQVS